MIVIFFFFFCIDVDIFTSMQGKGVGGVEGADAR